jgi:polyferredoxin
MVDKNSLLVLYRDEKKECIECKKCVRVCEMEIDIRDSPYQIECIHCGECIDACADVLRRLGKRTLIHYAWGEKGELTGNQAEPWYMRLGFRDAKRWVILAVILFYATALGVALSLRRPVLIAILPDRATLYRRLDDGEVTNKFRLKLANRSGNPAAVELRTENLPEARLLVETPIRLAPGESVERTFEIAVRPWPGAGEVNAFRIVAQASNEKHPDVFPNNFLLPVQKP